MAQNQWLLVEWVDENIMFSSYGVVHVKSLINEETDLNPGKEIFVRQKHGNSAQRAKILRISDSKQQLKEHKVLLEKQDHQIKNMLSMCMRTIKEIKTDPVMMYGGYKKQKGINDASTSKAVHQQANEPASSSGSDSEQVGGQHIRMRIQFNKPNMSCLTQTSTPNKLTVNGHSSQMKRLTVGSSTPLPPSVNRDVKKVPPVMLDKAVQTDPVTPMEMEKIQEMEAIMNRLYKQYLALVERLRVHHEERLAAESDGDLNESNAEGEVGMKHRTRLYLDTLNAAAKEMQLKIKAATEEIRREPAQTTNSVEPSLHTNPNEMVPLGLGHVTVPARLMNEIDWDSYSAATRQLLQAVFPRKVLATHSLTGKKSPAFANKPEKKCLNPKMIDDIVDTVAERCGVPKRSVRNCITIKCTDEAKLYRNRVQGRNQSKTTNQDNQENVPPSPMISHDSSNGTD